jgi:hypothetical protein
MPGNSIINPGIANMNPGLAAAMEFSFLQISESLAASRSMLTHRCIAYGGRGRLSPGAAEPAVIDRTIFRTFSRLSSYQPTVGRMTRTPTCPWRPAGWDAYRQTISCYHGLVDSLSAASLQYSGRCNHFW